MSKMVFNVEDKPKGGQLFAFALQQVLAIVAATIAVPVLIHQADHISAALLGSGLGTLIYIMFTKKKSPVILSSSFAFIGALIMASQNYGFLGILLGGFFAGIVHVIIAIIIHFVGTRWIDKILSPIVIGPVVSLIGLTLAPSAVSNLIKADGYYAVDAAFNTTFPYNLIALLCGLVTFFVVVICSSQRKNANIQMTPFLFGILAGYASAGLFSIFGYVFDVPYLKIIDFSPLINNFKDISVTSFIDFPRIALYESIKEIVEGTVKLNWIGVAEIALAFIPVSIVSFSEHIADHKNLGSIIDRDLLNDEPGLDHTLMGDGVGAIAGTAFGICPTTTYGESVGCVAISKNASIRTIILACFFCIGLSFLTPITAVLQTIPSCVMGGMCLALYGFIAVSGLRMIQGLEIGEGKNLYTLSVILVTGIGSLALEIPYLFSLVDESSPIYAASKFISISPIAFALILGVLTYFIGTKLENSQIKEEKE